MNNFGSENMGVLLHKLTKYQTLLSNCGAPSKAAVYNQKIDYYSNKLNGAGVSQNNIRNMRNLIGGVDNEEARRNVAALDALLNAPLSPPVAYVDPNLEIIQDISTSFDEVLRIHEQNKVLLTSLQKEKEDLETKNTELNKEIANKVSDIEANANEITRLTASYEASRLELQQKTQDLTAKITELEQLNTQKTELEKELAKKQALIDSQNVVISSCRARLEKPAVTRVNPVPDQTVVKLLERMKAEKEKMDLNKTVAP
jgi:DNA repair ATPase RecN